MWTIIRKSSFVLVDYKTINGVLKIVQSMIIEDKCKNKQEGLAVASIARDVVEMTPPHDHNAW